MPQVETVNWLTTLSCHNHELLSSCGNSSLFYLCIFFMLIRYLNYAVYIANHVELLLRYARSFTEINNVRYRFRNLFTSK